jgi:hypothetical protein
MSEQLREQKESVQESIDVSAEAEANLRRLQEAAKNESAPDAEILQSLEKSAKTEAISGREITVGEREATQDTPGMQRELKQVAYTRGMERIRSNLSAPERAFSKLVHNPAVDAVSNGVGRTLARPSGILAGALAALIGSTLLVYFSRHYGFTYNYLIFVLLYIGGYALGLVIEGCLKLFRR